MSQNQEIIESKLCAYIDGELDPEGRAEIEKHLEANPQHRRLLESLRATRDLIRWLPREPAPPELAETLSGQLERSVLLNYEGDSLRINFWPRLLAAAAIILLTAGLGVAVFYALPRSQKPQLALHTPPSEPGGDVVPVPPAGDVRPDTGALADADHTNVDREMERAKAGPEASNKDDTLVARNLAGENSKSGVGGAAKAANVQNVSKLDELAEQVAQNPAAFLASAEGANNAIAQNAVPPNYDALVVLVRSTAPEQTEKQLTGYLNQQQIQYRKPAVSQRLEGNLRQQQQGLSLQGDMAKKETVEKPSVESPAPSVSLNSATTQPSQNRTFEESRNVLASQQGYGGAGGGLAGNVYVCQMSRRQAEQLGTTIGNDAVSANQAQNGNAITYYNTFDRSAGQNQVSGGQARRQFAAKGGFDQGGGEREMLKQEPSQTQPSGLEMKLQDKSERSAPTTQPAAAQAYALNPSPSRDRLAQAALGASQTQPTSGPAGSDTQQEVAATQPSQLTIATTEASDEPLNVVIMVQPEETQAAAAPAPAATQPSNASLPQKARAIPSEQQPVSK